MYNRNSGTDEQEILQNQFTAYVKRAIHNKRLRYLSCMQRRINTECSLTMHEPFVVDSHDNIHSIVEMEAIRHSLGRIHEKERQVILSRVVEEKSVGQIAEEMKISYRAVTSLYYRGIKKLREILRGADGL